MPARTKTRTPNPQFIRDASIEALGDIARYVHAKAAKYPPQNPASTYKRQTKLGGSITKSDVMRTGNAYRVKIGTLLPYARYVEEGTGIYGPKGAPIKPTTAKALAWRATRGQLNAAAKRGFAIRRGQMVASGISKSKSGKTRRYRPGDEFMIFAKQVKGMPGWHFMRNAFMSPQTKSYFTARLARLAAAISKGA